MLAIMPYIEMFDWRIKHPDIYTKKITNDEGRYIASFEASNMETYYKYPKGELYMTNAWVGEFSRMKYYQKIINKWWASCR